MYNTLLKEAILHTALSVEGLWKGCGEELFEVMMLWLTALCRCFGFLTFPHSIPHIFCSPQSQFELDPSMMLVLVYLMYLQYITSV
jgi:hypothetical protein